MREKKENYKIMKIASDRNTLKLHLFCLMEVWGFVEGGVGVVAVMEAKLAETSACVCVKKRRCINTKASLVEVPLRARNQALKLAFLEN
jgi:hypothetical protein